MFLRVNLVTGVGRALKCQKFTPRFVAPFEIVEKVGAVAYRIALPSSLSNLHDVFLVSQLQKYVYDESHVIQVDVSENRMKDLYLELFLSGNFRGQKFFLGGESCNSLIFCYFIFNYFMCSICLYVIICVNPWV